MTLQLLAGFPSGLPLPAPLGAAVLCLSGVQLHRHGVRTQCVHRQKGKMMGLLGLPRQTPLAGRPEQRALVARGWGSEIRVSAGLGAGAASSWFADGAFPVPQRGGARALASLPQGRSPHHRAPRLLTSPKCS